MATRDTEICERLERLRVETFGSRGKSEMARQLGIRPSTYDRYERDRVPPADLLAKISGIADVTIDWLITGDGPKQAESIADIEAETLTRQFKEILVTRPDVRPLATQLLSWIAQQPRPLKEDRSEAGTGSWRTIPLIGATDDDLSTELQRALRTDSTSFDEAMNSASDESVGSRIEPGSLREIDGSSVQSVRVLRSDNAHKTRSSIQAAELPEGWGEQVVGVETSDDSMTPDVPAGSIAVAAVGRRPVDGEMVVAQIAGSAKLQLRRYHVDADDVLLVPSDPRIDVTRVSEADLDFIHRVVGIIETS